MFKTYDWRNMDADREREEAREAWADDEVARAFGGCKALVRLL